MSRVAPLLSLAVLLGTLPVFEETTELVAPEESFPPVLLVPVVAPVELFPWVLSVPLASGPSPRPSPTEQDTRRVIKANSIDERDFNIGDSTLLVLSAVPEDPRDRIRLGLMATLQRARLDRKPAAR